MKNILTIVQESLDKEFKDVLILFQKVINDRDAQAYLELNKFFDENNLRIDLSSHKILFYDKAEDRFVRFNYLVLDNNSFIDQITSKGYDRVISSEKVSDVLCLDQCFDSLDGILDFCKRLNEYCDICDEFGFKKDMIKSPKDWNFDKQPYYKNIPEYKDIPEFVKAFERICTEPSISWYI